MSCLGRAAVPAKRVWRGLSARLRLRRRTTPGKASSYKPMDRGPREPSHAEADMDDVGALAAGLGRLRKEVRTCEYSDVHVMWEMLSRSTTSTSRASGRGGAMAGAAAGKPSGRGSRVGRKAGVAWSRLASYCCCAL